MQSERGRRKVFSLNRLKNKTNKQKLIEAAGQESVVLAAKVVKLVECLNRGMNFSEFSFLSCVIVLFIPVL